MVVAGEMPVLDPALDALVERHWQDRSQRHALFNGRIFSADAITPGRITGHWTEYRRIVAQMADPALRHVLRVRSLAVCGALFCRDGLVVGRREPDSAYQAGLWQLPPAGSVDRSAATPTGADWRRALLAELQEELGIPADAVTALRPLCLVQHPTGVLDMGVRIDTGLSAAEVRAHHRTCRDKEYDELLVLAPADLEPEIARRGGRLTPSAPAFLRAALLPAPPGKQGGPLPT